MTDARYPDTVINGVPVAATPAEIDITTADQLRAALMHATRNRHPVVVVDMTSTRFCDCAGRHTLIAAYKRAQAEGSELRLVIPADGAVPRVFTLTGIDRFIPCFASVEEALAKTPGGTNPQPVPLETRPRTKVRSNPNGAGSASPGVRASAAASCGGWPGTTTGLMRQERASVVGEGELS